MRTGIRTRRGRRLSISFDEAVADAIDEAAKERSTAHQRVTASAIVREAVVRFLLPSEGTIRSQNGTNISDQDSGNRAPGGDSTG